MTTFSPLLSYKNGNLRTLMQRAWATNKPLASIMIACTALTGLGFVAVLADPRILLGQAIWVKPTKFALSVTIYAATLLAMLGSMPSRPRWADWLMTITGLTLWAEIIVIFVQAGRGQTSHYNMTTPFNAVMWAIMGVSIFILFGATIIGAVMLMMRKQPFGDFAGTRTLTWSLKLGLLVTVLAGYSVGTLMTTPTEGQRESMVAGEEGAFSIIGAHTVGAEDGGAGLPFVGWSTTHGDLRVGHFFGLHALQVIPLLGLFIARRPESWLSDRHRSTLVTVGAAGYAGYIAIVTQQALNAEPLVRPSTNTLLQLTGVVAAVAVTAIATLAHARWSAARRNMAPL